MYAAHGLDSIDAYPCPCDGMRFGMRVVDKITISQALAEIQQNQDLPGASAL